MSDKGNQESHYTNPLSESRIERKSDMGMRRESADDSMADNLAEENNEETEQNETRVMHLIAERQPAEAIQSAISEVPLTPTNLENILRRLQGEILHISKDQASTSGGYIAEADPLLVAYGQLAQWIKVDLLKKKPL